MVISLIFTTGCITQTSEKNLYVNSEYDFTIQLPIGYELMGDNTIAPDGGFDNVFLFYPKGFTNTLIKPRIDISVYEGTQFEITEEKGFSILSDEDL